MSSLSSLSLAGACALTLAACGPGGHGTPVPPDRTPGGPITADQVAGYWSGDWGRLVLRARGDLILGVYDHDEGTLTGKLSGDTLVGWWCEVPSRQPDHDAGAVELTFVGGAATARTIDGRWRYGAEGDLHEDWDLAWDAGEPPADLVARFDDPGSFCTQ